MSDFKTYYHYKFKEDINKFFFSIPDESKFHEDIVNKKVFSIQYERLTPEKNHLKFLEEEEKEYFAVALFFTILTDMVCFTYYKQYYNKFNALTEYPKLIGNCLGWCRFHLHPKEIFVGMNQGRSATDNQLVFYDKFLEAMETMNEETIGFFKKYLNEIKGESFWEKCRKEFPYQYQNEK